MRRAWQDEATTAYWDIATHSREPEGRDVLPTSSVSMDGSRHYPPAALEQTPSDRVSLMESGDGAGPVVCAERRQCSSWPRTGAQAQHGAATVAGILL